MIKKREFPFVGELKVGDLCMYGYKVYKVVGVDPFSIQGVYDDSPFYPCFKYWVKPIPLDSPNMWEINGFDLTGRRWSKVFRNGVVVYVNKLRRQRACNHDCSFMVEINFPPPYDETVSINEVVYLHQLSHLLEAYGLNDMELLYYDFG